MDVLLHPKGSQRGHDEGARVLQPSSTEVTAISLRAALERARRCFQRAVTPSNGRGGHPTKTSDTVCLAGIAGRANTVRCLKGNIRTAREP
jgi:hypothetical protein